MTLENGLGEHRVSEGGIRPNDCTGREPVLVEMSHLPSRWQRNMRSRLTPADRLELELLRRSLPATTPAESSLDGGPVQLLSSRPRQEADAFAPTDDPRQFDGLDGRGLVLVEPRPLSPGSPPGRFGRGVLAPSPPRWASSQTTAAAPTAGGLAAEAMEKVARAAAAADEAATASTWVPGNRFRMGLEKLVHLAAHELQDTAEKAELSARRNAVSRARRAEHAEPSPRDRLEGLKAAEAAIFRNESDEINDRAALEKAIHDHELRMNAVEARGYQRESRRYVTEALEAELANKMADSRRRESEVERERHRKLEKRQADVQAAKARVTKRREGRTNQALRLEQSRVFTANVSQLAWHVGKHASMSYKAQNARGMRQWVTGQKLHKEDMRRRMLRRVQELQEQKRYVCACQTRGLPPHYRRYSRFAWATIFLGGVRTLCSLLQFRGRSVSLSRVFFTRNEGARLRRALAARGRARAAIDEAIILHRAGHEIPSGNNLTEEVMHVLRPRSKLQGVNSGHDGSGGGPDPLCGEDGGDDGRHTGCILHRTQPQSPVETGHATEHRGPSPGNGPRGGATPCKPEAPPRLRFREQKNRRLSAGDVGKTVVVLAAVPRVTREAAQPTRPPPLSGTAGSAPVGSPSKEAKKVLPSQTGLPWPLGRRRW